MLKQAVILCFLVLTGIASADEPVVAAEVATPNSADVTFYQTKLFWGPEAGRFVLIETEAPTWDIFVEALILVGTITPEPVLPPMRVFRGDRHGLRPAEVAVSGPQLDGRSMHVLFSDGALLTLNLDGDANEARYLSPWTRLISEREWDIKAGAPRGERLIGLTWDPERTFYILRNADQMQTVAEALACERKLDR